MSSVKLMMESGVFPTPLQIQRIDDLKKDGYTWDRQLSISSCGVVLVRDKDIWFFGLEGEILHNP